MTICYKVCRRSQINQNVFLSKFAEGDLVLEYEIGKETKVPINLQERGLYPFVYDTLENAAGGTTVFGGESVLECECEEEVPIPTGYDVLEILAGRLLQGGNGVIHSFPPGTKCYKKVKPIRQVSVREIVKAWNEQESEIAQMMNEEPE